MRAPMNRSPKGFGRIARGFTPGQNVMGRFTPGQNVMGRFTPRHGVRTLTARGLSPGRVRSEVKMKPKMTPQPEGVRSTSPGVHPRAQREDVDSPGVEPRAGLKLAVAGKGGVGKTTIAAWLARLLAAKGKRVVAIDADPVPSLASALGIGRADEIVPINKMEQLISDRTGAPIGSMGAMFRLNPSVEDLPEKLSLEDHGVRLLVMGTIEQAGSGCACPQSVFLKALLRHLVLYEDDAVVLDMEAGVEHLGRATAMGVDVMLVVVEPGQRSVSAAVRISGFAAQLGVKRVLAVANKVRGPEDRDAISRALGDIEVAAFVDHDSRLVDSDLAGEAAAAHGRPAPEALAQLVDRLLA